VIKQKFAKKGKGGKNAKKKDPKPTNQILKRENTSKNKQDLRK
jgi:hypothetical protein